MSTQPRTLTLPAGWGVTQLVLHDEREDLSREADPFAGTALVHLRMDVDGDTTPAQVAAQDKAGLAATVARMRVVAEGELLVGPERVARLEVTFDDEEGRSLQQISLYLRRDRHLYTVSGMHRAGPRFDAVRASVVELAAGLR